MTYVREEIRGTSGQDIMKMNENFMNIFQKVFGDINFSDVDNLMKSAINTQWISFQGEGNLDSNYNYTVRFFVPPNVKEVKGASFNAILERYRMDSSVASHAGGVTDGAINLSVSGGGSCVGVGQTAQTTSRVTGWGGASVRVPRVPFQTLDSYHHGDLNVSETGLDYVYHYKQDVYGAVGVPIVQVAGNNPNIAQINDKLLLDLFHLQHTHELPPMAVSVSVPVHTHTGSAKVNIPSHEHKLNEGIKISTSNAGTTILNVNGTDVALLTPSESIKNNIDITQHIKIGEWNTITATTSGLARISLYGTVEVVVKNYK